MEKEYKDFSNVSSKELAEEMIRILDEKGAKDIMLFEVFEDTSLTDYHIIATGRSSTHVKSLSDELDFEMGQRKVQTHGIEGTDDGTWYLLDFITVIVHVFQDESRKFYNLERLQNPAHQVDISNLLIEE